MSKIRVRALLVALAFGAAVMTGPVAKVNAQPSYDAMFAATDWLAHKYGVDAYTTHAPMEYGTYAVTQGNLITFNTLYVENPDVLRADVASDVWSGYHPGAHCTPEQFIAAHEYAHVLDNYTGHIADDELNYALANGLSGEVSGYSLESSHEAIAEAFVAVECDVPTPAEQAIYDMLIY